MANPALKNKKELQRERQRQLQLQADIARQKMQRTNRVKKLGIRIGGGILTIAILVAAIAYALRGSASSVNARTVSPALGKPTSDLTTPLIGQFQKVGAPIHKNGKVLMLFIGAQYCPHCAGQRWAIVKALDQFGTFSNLTSSSNDDGSIATFDLTNAGYASKYVYFDHKDIQDRAHNNLQQLDTQENTLFNRFDSTGGIPLLATGGYALIGDGFDLSLINNQPFSTVQGALQHGSSSAWVPAINAEVNTITALICHADGGKPSSVCGRPAVRSVVATLH
ncbi:MAG: hypothetical protein NVSMB52_08780 [Chloroflexota bacterium]